MSEFDYRSDSKQKIGGGYVGGGCFGGGEMTDSQRIFAAAMRSRDIARDLTAVYMDRPYQYARIMQSLAKCMPTIKIRILNGRSSKEQNSLNRRRKRNKHGRNKKPCFAQRRQHACLTK